MCVRLHPGAVFTSLLLTSCLAVAAPPGVAEEDVACRVTGRAIQKFTACVFPMDFSGTKEIQIEVLGASVRKNVPWEARVSNPVITIKPNSQTFSADVKATANGLPWSGQVNGNLDITYSLERKAIVVAVRDAVAPVRVGPVSIDIDVSKEIPELPFVLPMPELTFPVKGQRIRVTTNPRLRFIDSAVVVVTSTVFEKE
jgi:hypothetical protein